MASAKIKLPNNNVISTFPVTGSNEYTAPSSDHSSADQEMRDLPSTTPPSDITSVVDQTTVRYLGLFLIQIVIFIWPPQE